MIGRKNKTFIPFVMSINMYALMLSVWSFQSALEKALACMVLEDPSIRVSLNEDTGQRLLSGESLP